MSLKLFVMVLCGIAPISCPWLADLCILRRKWAWLIAGNSLLSRINWLQAAQIHPSVSLCRYLLPLGPPDLAKGQLRSCGKQNLHLWNGNPDSIWEKTDANTQIVESRSQVGGEIRAEKLELQQFSEKQISECF